MKRELQECHPDPREREMLTLEGGRREKKDDALTSRKKKKKKTREGKTGENGGKDNREETAKEKKRVGEKESGARLVWRKGLSPEIGVKKTMNAGGVENRID
ncbi:hypothetical protein TNCV_3996171 [Trichonephila clavipes]|nr:hypothetical protein TNCV_3996171 [Trichonephila clavipes]